MPLRAKAINEIVYTSVATANPVSKKVTPSEPLVANVLISCLIHNNIWAPVDNFLNRMFKNANRQPSTMGFEFEVVVACLLVPNLQDAMLHLRNKILRQCQSG